MDYGTRREKIRNFWIYLGQAFILFVKFTDTLSIIYGFVWIFMEMVFFAKSTIFIF